MLILLGGLAYLVYYNNSRLAHIESNKGLNERVDDKSYQPGLKHQDLQEKSFIAQPHTNIRAPFGQPNPFEKHVFTKAPFLTPEYSKAYQKNYSNVTEIRTPDWRMDPNFNSAANNYSGYYTYEDVLKQLSNHSKHKNEFSKKY